MEMEGKGRDGPIPRVPGRRKLEGELAHGRPSRARGSKIQQLLRLAARKSKKGDSRYEAEYVNFSGARKARDFSGEKEKGYYVEFQSCANRRASAVDFGTFERARTFSTRCPALARTTIFRAKKQLE